MVLLIFITIFYGKLSFYTKKGITVVIPFFVSFRIQIRVVLLWFQQI